LKNSSISKQLLIYTIICLIPSVIIAFFKIYPILLTENSILYLHATSAQVIAALVALSLVAYTHLNTELNQKVNIDTSLEDAIFLTKINAFKDLTITILIGVLSISASLLVLTLFKYTIFQDFFMSMSFISLLIFTYALIRFVHRSFSPEAVQNNNDQVLEESKNELKDFIPDPIEEAKEIAPQTAHMEELKTNDFRKLPSELEELEKKSFSDTLGSFFIAFSSFESKLRKAYSRYNGFVPNNRNGSLRNIVNELAINFGVIPLNLHKEILSLVKVRNSLAHASHETNIEPEEITRYIQLIHELERKIDLHTKLNWDEMSHQYIQPTTYKVTNKISEIVDDTQSTDNATKN